MEGVRSLQLLYWCCLGVAALYAVIRGGGPERAGTAILVVASLASVVAYHRGPDTWQAVDLGLLVIGACSFAAYLLLAFVADRQWPQWAAGMQLATVATHLIKLIEPTLSPIAYAYLQGFWAYPIIVTLMMGTRRHRQYLVRTGGDSGWRSFSVR